MHCTQSAGVLGTDETHADTRAHPALLHASPNDEKVGQGQLFYKGKEKKNLICDDRLGLVAGQKTATSE